MAYSDVRFISNVTKVYPDMIKIIIYKTPVIYTLNNSPKINDSDDYLPRISSLNRTKSLIKDIVLCNDFELFCTFTFDPKKIDSFNFNRCYRSMSTWLHHQRDNSREKGIEFKYLIIPERHKSGRWHFHALISGYTSTLKATKYKTSNGRQVLNITSFRSGFTTAVAIDSKESVSNYVTKYITKDFIKTFNQRRFFASRYLTRPEKKINSDIFRKSLPIFRKKIRSTEYFDEFIISY